jgi:hypothetical protein
MYKRTSKFLQRHSGISRRLRKPTLNSKPLTSDDIPELIRKTQQIKGTKKRQLKKQRAAKHRRSFFENRLNEIRHLALNGKFDVATANLESIHKDIKNLKLSPAASFQIQKEIEHVDLFIKKVISQGVSKARSLKKNSSRKPTTLSTGRAATNIPPPTTEEISQSNGLNQNTKVEGYQKKLITQNNYSIAPVPLPSQNQSMQARFPLYKELHEINNKSILTAYKFVMGELSNLCNEAKSFAKEKNEEFDSIAYIAKDEVINKAITNCTSQIKEAGKTTKTVGIKHLVCLLSLTRPFLQAKIFSHAIVEKLLERQDPLDKINTPLNELNDAFNTIDILSHAFQLDAVKKKLLNKLVVTMFFESEKNNCRKIQCALIADVLEVPQDKVDVTRIVGKSRFLAQLNAHNLLQLSRDVRVPFDIKPFTKSIRLVRPIPPRPTPK